ncbi:MAG TPA: GAF and ANTAR domain-containing protein [Mycobacterium sp.]|nr:GAF and ANTAR domain-containing protein [Mycobacterium sp.]
MEGGEQMDATADRLGESQFLGYDRGLFAVAATSVDLHQAIADTVREVRGQARPHYEPVAAQFASLAPTYVVGVADAGALLIVGRGDWRGVSEPGSNSARVEQLHMDLGEGPAFDAARKRCTVRVSDATTETRWPRVTAAITAHTPVRSLLCVPLYTHLRSWGAMMLLASQPNGLDDEAGRAATILATHAALTLEAVHHERHYRSALGSRDIIGQAKGMVMERFDVDATAAFALLTGMAEENHCPVVVGAKEMLGSKLAPGA